MSNSIQSDKTSYLSLLAICVFKFKIISSNKIYQVNVNNFHLLPTVKAFKSDSNTQEDTSFFTSSYAKNLKLLSYFPRSRSMNSCWCLASLSTLKKFDSFLCTFMLIFVRDNICQHIKISCESFTIHLTILTQTDSESTIETSGNQKQQWLENTTGQVRLPI